MKDNGDVLLTKFIGKFKHNYSQTIEAFTDGRQNDVDLIDISLTWHMKVIKDFDFELFEYFNGDEDNMDRARKFRITFNDTFDCLKIETTLYGVWCSDLTYSMYYKRTDIIHNCDELPPIAEDMPSEEESDANDAYTVDV